MALCQKLYENGHITYMRTDSPIYKDFLVSSIDFINRSYGDNYSNKELLKMMIKIMIMMKIIVKKRLVVLGKLMKQLDQLI